MRGLRWSVWAPVGWSLALAVLLLWPALAPGYVLSYDMVWVPDLALRPDVLGVGSGLPRAVPSDAVVALLDEVVPGMVLQKLVLLGAVVGAGLGAARLVRGLRLPAVLLAVTLAEWNPFVVERLVLGHWPVLLGYAAIPWLLLAARDWRHSGRLPDRLLWLLPLGSLSISAGLAGLLVVVVCGPAGRARLRAVAVGLLAQLPWLAAGLLHAGSAVTDPAGAGVFAAAGEGSLPEPLATLSLGGIWNAEVLPASRAGAAAWIATAVLLALAVLGGWRARRRGTRTDRAAPVALWSVGWGVALLTWVAPGALGEVAAVLPGVGVLRDGSRLLGLCLPLLVLCVAHGADAVLEAAAGRPAPRAARWVLAGALVVWPVTLMTDAAGGVSGRLAAASYPASYAAARAAVDGAPGDLAGDLLSLPFASYRQPTWNGGRKVLDPVPRYLPRDAVVADDLVVSGVTVPGEDPRAAQAAEALAAPSADARAAALAAMGISLVAIDPAAGPAPAVTGRTLSAGPDLVLLALEDPVSQRPPRWWSVVMSLAWSLWAALWLAAPSRHWWRSRPTSERDARSFGA